MAIFPSSAQNACTSLWTNMRSGSIRRSWLTLPQGFASGSKTTTGRPIRVLRRLSSPPGRGNHSSRGRGRRVHGVRLQVSSLAISVIDQVPHANSPEILELDRQRDSIAWKPQPSRMAWYDARSPSIGKIPSGFHSDARQDSTRPSNMPELVTGITGRVGSGGRSG